jgi:Secretion system C-terminal sorting domain
MRHSIFFILFIFYQAKMTNAQSLSYQINSIGSNANMTIGSLSFQVDHMANCYTLANGLSIYKPQTSIRVIDNGCKVPIQFGQYGLRIYPQPIGDHPRIQLTRSSIPNEPFSIRWYSIEGRLVLEETQNGLTLSSGYIINTSILMAGAYIVQVVSENSLDIIQVIKQD